MTVISSRSDPRACTLTFVADVEADADRVWQLWENPRLLERWWGPPTWPATFHRHDFVPGGRSHYSMTGPRGERAYGRWVTGAIEKPYRLEFEDSFADENGKPSGELGSTRCVVTLAESELRTRLSIMTTFTSRDQLDQMVELGMEAGMRDALGQIDAILADDYSI